MKTIQTSISGIDVLIQTVDDGYVNYEAGTNPLLADSGINVREIKEVIKETAKKTTSKVEKAFEQASKIISAFADLCKKQFDVCSTADEMEIEYSLSIGTGAKLWTLVDGKAESAIKVRMKWNRNNSTPLTTEIKQ
jgi:hypothetical protein